MSLLAIVYGSGGIPKANEIIRTPTPFYYDVMAVVAMAATSIFSNRTYNN